MKKYIVVLVGICLLVLAGCTKSPTADPTVPPVPPTHSIAGSTLPAAVAGYSALETNAGNLTTMTYARDAQPLDLAVVTFDSTGQYGTTTLTNQQWYEASRCGILWQGDVNQTPRPSQSACITVLTDGVMTTVSGGSQTPADLSILANGIYDLLA